MFSYFWCMAEGPIEVYAIVAMDPAYCECGGVKFEAEN